MIDDYVRRAHVVRVIDGDTVEICIELGFDITMTRSCRLAHINAPELHGATAVEGKAAKVYLEAMLRVGAQVRCKTVKVSDKYGRYVAELNLLDDTRSINDRMVEAGHAIYKEYD